MPRLQSIDIDPVDVDANGIAELQTPSGAGDLTLDGALISGGTYTSGDGGARQIAVITAADDNARTLTITGTDADGNAQTETMTGSQLNTTTTESTKYWGTITSIAIDAATAGSFTVGTVDELASKTIKLNRHATTGGLIHLDVTGTINVTAQVGAWDPDDYSNQGDMPWIDSQDADLVGATGNAIGNLDIHSVATRVIVNSYSSGAEVQVYLSQGYK